MVLSVKHPVPSDGRVDQADYEADHVLTGVANKLIGLNGAGQGAEVSLGANIALADGTLTLTADAAAAAASATTAQAAAGTATGYTVTPKFVDKSLNRVIPANTLQGFLVEPGASIHIANADWAIAVVPVTAGGTVTLSYKTYQGFYWKTAGGAIITAPVLSAPTNVFPAGGFQLAVPATAVELFYSVEKQYLPRLQIVDGAVTITTNIMAVTPAKVSDAHPWAGKTIMFKGDSTYQDQAWVTNMCTAIGATAVNLSQGGQGIGHGLTYFTSVPAVNRAMVEADVDAVDAIVLSLTYNSAFFNMTVGSMSDAVPALTGAAGIPATFIPAMRYVIRQYRAWNPEVAVFVVGTHHRYEGLNEAEIVAGDARQVTYRNHEIAVCLEESVPYFDFMTESGLNRSNIAIDWPDGIHGSPDGYRRRWQKPIQGWIETKGPLI